MHSTLVAILASLAATAVAQGSGRTTFYGGNVRGGMCSFSTYSLPPGIYGTALSAQNWDKSAHCGACIRVKGPNGNSIKAMIVDQCPECPRNGLDLFKNGFEQLAPAKEGIIQTQWEYTDCGISSPLQVHMKEGVSPYWFSAQVVNADGAVADVQVSTDGGSTWKGGLQRKEYNFFEQSSGFGKSNVAVRVIGVDGGSAVAKNVAVTSGNLVTAGGNV